MWDPYDKTHISFIACCSTHIHKFQFHKKVLEPLIYNTFKVLIFTT